MDDAGLLSVAADANLAELRRAYMRDGNGQRNDRAALESITRAYVAMRNSALERERDSPDALAAPSNDGSEQARRDAVFEALERREVRVAERLLDDMAADGHLRWERLREEPDPAHLAWWFGHFGERELLQGRGSALAALMASDDFDAALSRAPGLLPEARRLAVFAVLENNPDVARFLEAHPDPTQPVWQRLLRSVENHFGFATCDALGLPRAALPAIWSSPLALTPSAELEDTVLRPFADEHASVARLDTLRTGAEPLFWHLSQAVQAWAPRDDRVWHELTDSERAGLRALVIELERASASDPYRRFLHYLPHMALLLVLGALVVLGWSYGLLALFLVPVAVVTLWTKGSASVYRRALRRLVTPHVAGSGMPPDRVIEAAWHVGHEPGGKNKVAEDYLAHFTHDPVLANVAALHRLRKAREQGAVAQLRLASLHVPPALASTGGG